MPGLGSPRFPSRPCFFFALSAFLCLGKLLKFLSTGIFLFPLMQLQKVKEDHAYKEQMDEPAVQRLQAEVNALKQNIQEYNTKQKALRSRAKSIDEKKEGILAKVRIPVLCCLFLPLLDGAWDFLDILLFLCYV